MEELRWKWRPLLLFAPHDSEDLKWQREAAEQASPGISDRDMAVIQVAGDQVTTLTGPASSMNAEQLRRFAGVSAGDFQVVLVGKDGGIKSAWKRPVSLDAVFELIDSMPMRKHEMRGT